jgi:hypothetical protein
MDIAIYMDVPTAEGTQVAVRMKMSGESTLRPAAPFMAPDVSQAVDMTAISSNIAQ